jgi:hypothetical protein
VTDSLAVLQRRLHALITQPRPIAEAAEALASVDAGIAPLPRWVQAGSADDAAERVAIYARSHFARLRESLGEDFPCVRAAIGAGEFDRLTVAYLLAHPSTEPSLHTLGRQLPAFLARWRAPDHRADLSELAALEYARLVVFAEADAPLLGADALASLPPDAWPGLTLRTTAACRVVDVHHAVDDVWLAADRGLPLPEVAHAPRALLVWRCAFTVRLRPLAADEERVVRRMLVGLPFAEACELLAANEEEPGSSATRIAPLLRQWITDQLLAAP